MVWGTDRISSLLFFYSLLTTHSSLPPRDFLNTPNTFHCDILFVNILHTLHMAKGLSTAQLGGVVAAALFVIAGVGLVANNLGAVPGSVPALSPPVEVDVSGVECEGIEAARAAIAGELEAKNSYAQALLNQANEQASDDYWEKMRAHDQTLNECMSNANLADPCKKAFEEQSLVMERAIADPAAERIAEWDAKIKEVKDAYQNCLKTPPEEATYEGQSKACQDAYDAAEVTALAERAIDEKAARDLYDQAVADAQADHDADSSALDALQEECNKKPAAVAPSSNFIAGGSYADSVSPACTGTGFIGNDPEIEELRKLLPGIRGNVNKFKAAGLRINLAEWQQRLADVQAQIRVLEAGPRSCQTDADCGNPDPVCCSSSEVGRVKCEKGVVAGIFGGSGTCTNETSFCEDPEVCAGKPAQCVAPPKLYISVIEYGSYQIPLSQVRRSTGNECDKAEHWHFNGGATLQGEVIPDPDRDGCGFGKTSEVAVIDVEIDEESEFVGEAFWK